MELYDAFAEGVEPGGLRSRNEIRLLICYLICKTDGITKNQINNILCEKSLANYFEVNQALSEVIRTGNVRSELKGSEEYLYPTELGKANTNELENELPYSVKETALNAAFELLTKLKREQENKIEIVPHGDGFDITVSIMDGNDKLMSVTLFVADKDQAFAAKEKFLQDPVKIYSTIVALLLA